MDIVAPLIPQGLEKVFCRQCNQFHKTFEVEFYNYVDEGERRLMTFRCFNNGHPGDTLFRAPILPAIDLPEEPTNINPPDEGEIQVTSPTGE